MSSAAASTPFDDTYVTCAAFHPQRASAIIATRRPNAYLTEVNLAVTPATTVGMPAFTAFTATQLFVTITDSGADRVVAVLDNRAVEVYSWNAGRALLYRHVPKSRTIRDYAVRFAMAELFGSTLYLVPLLRTGERGRGVAKEPLPDDRAYHSACDPEMAYAESEAKQFTTAPASRVYFFDCFKSNNDEKHVPYIELDLPIVGMRLHTGGAPLLAVLCRDSGLRLYDLADPKSPDKPLLYNVAPLGKACASLQLPTFSKVGLNGDGRTKVFDFVPAPTQPTEVRYGKKGKKSKRVYSNITVAVAEERRLSVFDVTVPGTCDEVYSVSAPPKVDFTGVICDPVGSARSSGTCTTGELETMRGGHSDNDVSRGHGSRRLVWAIASDGQLVPYTMDDSLCVSTKLLAVADWVRPVPLLPGSSPGDVEAEDAALAAAMQHATASGSPGKAPPTSAIRQREARALAARGPSTALVRGGRADPMVAGDAALLADWRCREPSLHLTEDLRRIAGMTIGRLLRLQVALHPTLPLLLGVVPLEGSLFVRRSTTLFQDQHHLCTGGASAAVSPVPGAALSPHVLLSRRTSFSAIHTAPDWAFIAESRGGLSTIRIVAADRRISPVAKPSAEAAEDPDKPALDAVAADGDDAAGGGGDADKGGDDEADAQQVPTESHLVLVIEEKGQIAVSHVEATPLRHLGASAAGGEQQARYWLLAVGYSVGTSQRSLSGQTVSQLNALLIVVDTNAIQAPVSAVGTVLPLRQTVLAASQALKWVRVIEHRSVGRVCGPMHRPSLALTSRRADVSREQRCYLLDMTRFTSAMLDGHTKISEDLRELRPTQGCFAGAAAWAAEHGSTAIAVTDDTAATVRDLADGKSGHDAADPLVVGYSAGSKSVAVFGRGTGVKVGVVNLGGDASSSQRALTLEGLRAATCLSLAAATRDDDTVSVGIFTSDGVLSYVVFEAEQPDSASASTGGIVRRGFVAWQAAVPVTAAPASLTFLSSLLVAQLADSSVVAFTAGGVTPHRIVTLPPQCQVLSVAPDRIVAVRSLPRTVRHVSGNSLALDPPLARVSQCPIALFGPLVSAEVDLAVSRVNNAPSTKADLELVAQSAALGVQAMAFHLGAHSALVGHGPLSAMTRFGFHLLAADILKAQAASVVSDLPLVLQPAAARAAQRLQIASTNTVVGKGQTGRPLGRAGALVPCEADGAWPLPVVDTAAMHAERARQFTAIAHHHENAGALVVVDTESAAAVRHGAPVAQVNSSVPGISAAHQTLLQVAWVAGNERGQYAFDTLVAIAAHVPHAALPGDIANALPIMLFGSDAAHWRAYRVACAMFGDGSPAVNQFIENSRSSVSGRKLPRVIAAHHRWALEAATQAKRRCAAGAAGPIFAARETFMKTMRAKAADVRLGAVQSGKLPTVDFPVSREILADQALADSLLNFDGERALLAQSALSVWPSLAGAIGGGKGVGAAIGAGRAGSSAQSASNDHRSSHGGSARTGRSYGNGSVGYAPSGYTTTAYAAPAAPTHAAPLPAPAPLAASGGGANAAPAYIPPPTDYADALDASTADASQVAAAQPSALHAPEKSAGTLAEEQQRAVREAFLSGAGPGGGEDDSDSSSDDGTGPRKVEIKLRAPSNTGPAASADGAAFFGETRTYAASASTGGGGGRRIGGSRSPQHAATASSASAGDAAAATPVNPASIRVEDELSQAFAAVEAGTWARAEHHLARAVSKLEVDAEELDHPTRLPLVAQYRLLCRIQTHLASDAMATASAAEAMHIRAHALQLHVAGEHLAGCMQTQLEDAIALQWPATASQLLTLLKYAKPELFDTDRGESLDYDCNALPGFGDGSANGSDDSRTVRCLQDWCMCAGSLVVDEAPTFVQALVPCGLCELKFAPAFVARRMVDKLGASAADSRIIECPYCGAGFIPLPPGTQLPLPAAAADTTATAADAAGPETVPEQQTLPPADPVVTPPQAPVRPPGSSMPTPRPAAEPPQSEVQAPPLPSLDDMDSLFGGAKAPAPRAAPQPAAQAAALPAADDDFFAGGDWNAPPAQAQKGGGTMQGAAPAASSQKRNDDMDFFFN